MGSCGTCSVLQCVAVCCSVLQCVAVCCNVLQCVAVMGSGGRCSVLQCVAMCCSMLQCVAATVSGGGAMEWLRSVGSIKLLVSFAKEPYKRDDILQKRPLI